MSNETTPAETTATDTTEQLATTPEAEAPELPETPAAEATPEAETERLGEGGQKALDRERQARKDAERDLRAERERSAALQAAADRRAIADELELTAEQAELLQGADRDEMMAHAQRMLAAFAPPRRFGRPVEELRSGVLGFRAAPPTPAEVAEEVLRG